MILKYSRVAMVTALMAAGFWDPAAAQHQSDQKAEPAATSGAEFDAESSGPDPLATQEPQDQPALIAPGAASKEAQPNGQETAPQTSTEGAGDESHSPQQAQNLPQEDPLVQRIRARLAEAPDLTKGSDKADIAGLTAYYAQAKAKPIWTTKEGLNDKAKAILAEFKKADEWGLDPADFDVALGGAGVAYDSDTAAADDEIKLSKAVLKYARYARGGRFEPAQISEAFDEHPRLFDPKSVLNGISAAAAPDIYLQGLNPKQEGFKRLRQALLKLKTNAPLPDQVRLPKSGPSLKIGDDNEQVALVRQRLNVKALEPDQQNKFDDALAEAIKLYQKREGLKETGQIDAKLRTSLNGPEAESGEQQRLRIIANMERWRWLPDDLGAFYVFNNIPEQLTRVFKDGKDILTERIVVGKPDTPTPIFSARMQFVIFHPEWGVPDGIKTNELAPKLKRASASGGGYSYRRNDDDEYENDFWFFGQRISSGPRYSREGGGGSSSSRVLQSYGLRVSYNGHEVDPDQVDWSSVDIRRYQFIQPSGGRNVLGVVKFRFPNKHDVYMHDTPDKNLFAKFPRAFSHGCMRTQNPVHLAEVILQQDKGWSADRVHAMATSDNSAPDEIKLTSTIPVHVVYFTASADEEGKVKYQPDIYGLDGKLATAIAKRPVHFGSEPAESAVKETRSSQAEPHARQEAPIVRRRRTWDDDDDRRFLWRD